MQRGLLLALVLLLSVPVRPSAAIYSKTDTESVVTEALWNRLKEMPASRRPRIGLVLGGGGARGLAHIGVLKVLEQERVPVDVVIGTSVGALVGALYAAGLPLDQIERLGQDIGWDKLTNLSGTGVVKLLVSEQMLSTQKMESYLKQYIGDKQFPDLKKTFACVAADLKTGEQIVLREGSVVLAARASATMPGLFSPVPYRHRLLVDGGIVNNIPTDVAQLFGVDVIICVPVPADFSQYDVTNVLTTLTQALYIQGEVINQDRLAKADVTIQPKVGDVTALQLWRSKECIAAGVSAARESMPEIRKVLAKKFFEKWATENFALNEKPSKSGAGREMKSQ